MTRDTAFLADILTTGFSPQEVSLVSFTLQLSAFTRKQLYRRLQQAYASGSLKLVKRLQALLALAQGQSVREVAEICRLVSKPCAITAISISSKAWRVWCTKLPQGGPANAPKLNANSSPSGSKRIHKTQD